MKSSGTLSLLKTSGVDPNRIKSFKVTIKKGSGIKLFDGVGGTNDTFVEVYWYYSNPNKKSKVRGGKSVVQKPRYITKTTVKRSDKGEPEWYFYKSNLLLF